MSTPVRPALIAAAALIACSAVSAQDMPKRKPGLWEVSMEMQGMPPAMAGRTSSQCVDEKTDSEMQRKAWQNQAKTQCSAPSVKRGAGSTTVDVDCTSDEGKSHMTAKITGDMQSAYRMDNHMTFDPPRHGMREMNMVINAKHAGACPADMKPGDIRLAGGMTMNPGQPGMGIDPSKIANMSPEERAKMIEQLKKMKPQQ